MPDPSITCPDCGATSHHPYDVAEGYCGRCHDWTTPPRPLQDGYTEWGVWTIGSHGGQHVTSYGDHEDEARAYADANADGRSFRTVLVSRVVPGWTPQPRPGETR